MNQHKHVYSYSVKGILITMVMVHLLGSWVTEVSYTKGYGLIHGTLGPDCINDTCCRYKELLVCNMKSKFEVKLSL